MNQQPNSLKDLEPLKRYEEKINEYREKRFFKTEAINYKHLAYKVKNPFRGV